MLDQAIEHHTPSLPSHQTTEHLISVWVVRPGVVTLMEPAAAVCAGPGR
ncbi:hypothetical protein ACFY4C_21530 [Actinomadura viridis]